MHVEKLVKEGSVEQGPINLSPEACIEQKLWVTNADDMDVYRACRTSPENIIKKQGLHSDSLGNSGAEFHLIGNNDDDYAGAISTTSEFSIAREFYHHKKSRTQDQSVYIYKIALPAKNGVNMLKTLEAKYKAGLLPCENTEYYKLDNDYITEARIELATKEKEFMVLGSIALNQIEIWDPNTDTFKPLTNNTIDE